MADCGGTSGRLTSHNNHKPGPVECFDFTKTKSLWVHVCRVSTVKVTPKFLSSWCRKEIIIILIFIFISVYFMVQFLKILAECPVWSRGTKCNIE